MMTMMDWLNDDTALYLDFDGTLVEIAERPDSVSPDPQLVSLLLSLKDRLGGALAIISGRPIGEIDTFLAPIKLCIAGVHGSERRDAQGRLHRLDAVDLTPLELGMLALAARYPALLVERKPGALALHYRKAPELADDCHELVRAFVGSDPGLVILSGKMVVEVLSAAANKGLAIERFHGEPPFCGRRPVFIGDDVTDESGFAWVQQQGGTGVKIGEGASIATVRMSGPATLAHFFGRWLVGN